MGIRVVGPRAAMTSVRGYRSWGGGAVVGIVLSTALGGKTGTTSRCCVRMLSHATRKRGRVCTPNDRGWGKAMRRWRWADVWRVLRQHWSTLLAVLLGLSLWLALVRWG